MRKTLHKEGNKTKKELSIQDVKKTLRKLLKYKSDQNLLEGLITVTELCALCLGKNIKIAVVQE